MSEKNAEELDIAASAEVRRVVENWAIFRDAGAWDDFAAVWHDDGWMTATWFQGPFADFIRVSREGFEHGVQIAHFLGGHTSAIAGDRAIAQTKMKIEQRAQVHGVLVDVTCSGRFYDFLERRPDRWGIVRRQPIYERDRLDIVDPAARLSLDPAVLDRFPAGYRNLAYVQHQIGYQVMTGLPGLTGPAVERLYAEGREWLAGSDAPGTSHLHGPRSPGADARALPANQPCTVVLHRRWRRRAAHLADPRLGVRLQRLDLAAAGVRRAPPGHRSRSRWPWPVSHARVRICPGRLRG